MQSLDADDFGAIEHLRFGVDEWVVFADSALVAVAFAVAPFAGCVEVFQRKAERVDAVVAAGARSVFAVNLQALADGGFVDAGDFVGDFADVRLEDLGF